MALDLARERRRRYLEIALRRARPGTGSSPAFYRRRDWSALAVDLSSIKTPYVIVGAVAARLYMPERATHDIDLLVHVSDREALAAELDRMGFTKQGNLSIGGSTWIAADGQGIDVIESGEPWVREALESAVRSPDGLPVIRLPYLVLLKLTASRGQDVADLSKMLGLATPEARDEIRRVVRRYQPEDLEDLESLIALGELEFGPASEGHR